jgi:hypothetical protein
MKADVLLGAAQWSATHASRFISEEWTPIPSGYVDEWAPEPVWTLTAVNHTQSPSCLARSLVAIVEKVSPASSCTRREQTSEPIYWKDHNRAYKKAQTTLKWATTPLSDSNISTVLHHIHPTPLMTSFRYKSKTNFRSKRKKKDLIDVSKSFSEQAGLLSLSSYDVG